MNLIKQKKLKLLGHICRMENQRLVKTVMLGIVVGDRPRGRPLRSWSEWLVRMFTARGWTTGERQTTVETNHWPQRLTWVVSSREERRSYILVIWILLITVDRCFALIYIVLRFPVAMKNSCINLINVTII